MQKLQPVVNILAEFQARHGHPQEPESVTELRAQLHSWIQAADEYQLEIRNLRERLLKLNRALEALPELVWSYEKSEPHDEDDGGVYPLMLREQLDKQLYQEHKCDSKKIAPCAVCKAEYYKHKGLWLAERVRDKAGMPK